MSCGFTAYGQNFDTDVLVKLHSKTTENLDRGGLKHDEQKLCYDRRSVGQSVLVSGCIWGPRPDFYYCQTVAGLLI
jgi:hypothetical protein